MFEFGLGDRDKSQPIHAEDDGSVVFLQHEAELLPGRIHQDFNEVEFRIELLENRLDATADVLFGLWPELHRGIARSSGADAEEKILAQFDRSKVIKTVRVLA